MLLARRRDCWLELLKFIKLKVRKAGLPPLLFDGSFPADYLMIKSMSRGKPAFLTLRLLKLSLNFVAECWL